MVSADMFSGVSHLRSGSRNRELSFCPPEDSELHEDNAKQTISTDAITLLFHIRPLSFVPFSFKCDVDVSLMTILYI